MNKKIILAGVVLLILIGGGIFLFLNQQAQNAVKDLNANLPEGVRVIKSLLGNEYTVVNEIDGYDFKTPSAWHGLDEVLYTPEETTEGYTFTTLEMQGKEGAGTIAAVNKVAASPESLQEWVRASFEVYGATRELSETEIGELKVVVAQAGEGLFDMPMYFFQKASAVYIISNPSEDFIGEIILNGNW